MSEAAIKPDWVSPCGRAALYCADCLAVLPTLAAGSVDAVVTDPPYGMAYQSAWRTDKAARFDPIAGDDAPFVWFLPGAARSLRVGGCLLCFCRWDGAEAFRDAIGWAGLEIGGQVVWDRMAHGMGDLNGSPAPQHDHIWFATAGKFTFPGDRPKSVVRSMRLSGDKLDHPNEKPEDLMTTLAGSYTAIGETILDPFMGSGTTGVAAIKTGRRFIGIEIEPKYFAIAKRRISQAIEDYALFQPPEPLPKQQAMFEEPA